MPNLNFYFTIIDSIRKDGKLPEISISKQALNYYVKLLKIDAVISKLGYGTWAVDEAKFKEFMARKQVKKTKKVTLGQGKDTRDFFTSSKIRGHGFILSFVVPKITRWKERELFLKRQNIQYKSIGFNKSIQSIVLRGWKVWLCQNSIVIYTPKGQSYFSDSANTSENYAIYDNLQVIKTIENMMGISLKVGRDYCFKVARRHHARINDNLARFCDERKQRLYISNKDGLWLISDFSFNSNELETVSAKTSHTDMDNIIAPFMNDIKDYYDKNQEVPLLSRIIHISSNIIQSHNMYAENIQSHIAAINELGRQVKLLGEQVRKLKSGNR